MEAEQPGITRQLEANALEIDDRTHENAHSNKQNDFEYDEKQFKHTHVSSSWEILIQWFKYIL